MKGFLIVLGVIIGIVALAFLCDSFNLLEYKFFAPKMESARRNVYENTPSYVQGKINSLNSYRLQYMQAKSAQDSTAIRMTIIQEMSNFDLKYLPSDLRSFYEEVYNYK